MTNVAVVRQKKCGKRFEIACFRNKVLSWRKGTETDIDEVLQTHTVFSNVSKGLIANRADLMEAFGTDEQDDICIEILKKGELQVSREERDDNQEQGMKEIATIVSDKCVNPETNRPYPITQIERAMQDIHFSFNAARTAKQQALDVIRALKEKFPIERAQMSLRIRLPAKESKAAKLVLLPVVAKVESEEWDGDVLEMVCAIDPGAYRQIDEIVRAQSKGRGSVEIVSVRNVEGGEKEL